VEGKGKWRERGSIVNSKLLFELALPTHFYVNTIFRGNDMHLKK